MSVRAENEKETGRHMTSLKNGTHTGTTSNIVVFERSKKYWCVFICTTVKL